jgi:hypothetical protein
MFLFGKVTLTKVFRANNQPMNLNWTRDKNEGLLSNIG